MNTWEDIQTSKIPELLSLILNFSICLKNIGNFKFYGQLSLDKLIINQRSHFNLHKLIQYFEADFLWKHLMCCVKWVIVLVLVNNIFHKNMKGLSQTCVFWFPNSWQYSWYHWYSISKLLFSNFIITLLTNLITRASMWENLTVACKQQRRRSACESAQSEQHHCYSPSG